MSSWISAGAAAVAVIWIISLSFADTPTVARFTKRATSYERVTWVDEGWNEAAPPATTTRRRHHHDRSAHVQTELRPGHVRLTPATRLRQHPGRHERTHAADHGLLGGRIPLGLEPLPHLPRPDPVAAMLLHDLPDTHLPRRPLLRHVGQPARDRVPVRPRRLVSVGGLPRPPCPFHRLPHLLSRLVQVH